MSWSPSSSLIIKEADPYQKHAPHDESVSLTISISEKPIYGNQKNASGFY
jgi:hypothetical protein